MRNQGETPPMKPKLLILNLHLELAVSKAETINVYCVKSPRLRYFVISDWHFSLMQQSNNKNKEKDNPGLVVNCLSSTFKGLGLIFSTAKPKPKSRTLNNSRCPPCPLPTKLPWGELYLGVLLRSSDSRTQCYYVQIFALKKHHNVCGSPWYIYIFFIYHLFSPQEKY